RISLAVPDLAPLSNDDVQALLRHRLAVAGAREGLVTSDALAAIAAASEGNAGTAVSFASAALRRAFVERSAEVGSRHVEPVPARARTGLVA
ncbi:MAG TPA: hypothetical protein PLF26_20655, partial [Blastocatellia bacterium]|nr:hypothetical protein [Blastocatellia bacterium]